MPAAPTLNPPSRPPYQHRPTAPAPEETKLADPVAHEAWQRVLAAPTTENIIAAIRVFSADDHARALDVTQPLYYIREVTFARERSLEEFRAIRDTAADALVRLPRRRPEGLLSAYQGLAHATYLVANQIEAEARAAQGA